MKNFVLSVIAVMCLIVFAGGVTAEEVTLEPLQDATIHDGDGTTANGSGSYLFTGANQSQGGSQERRALVAFDIESAIPVGATITSAALELTVSKTNSGDQTVGLHRVLESWGEGASDPGGQEGRGTAAVDGDVTWVHRTYPSNMWSDAGGTFTGTASATTTVGGVGSVVFSSTSELVDDVQTWLDNPMDNFGWALVMPSPPSGSAKRFNSRENSSASTRPRLFVSYEGGAQSLDSPRVFIPAAARVEGVGGSFFVTTLDVHNSGSADATIRFAWLPRNTDNSAPVFSSEIVLGPGESRRYDDFLFEVFGLEDGAGAAAVFATMSDEIEVMTRTFNQGVEGTFGQSLPGVPVAELIPADTEALLLFLTENASLRSNIGLVNGVGMQIRVQWELFASDGSSLGTGATNLPPWGNKQLNQVLGDVAPVEAAYAHVWTSTAGGAFTCYGSVLDNQTSDPTTVPPR